MTEWTGKDLPHEEIEHEKTRERADDMR
jgi:hypothetical protein